MLIEPAYAYEQATEHRRPPDGCGPLGEGGDIRGKGNDRDGDDEGNSEKGRDD